MIQFMYFMAFRFLYSVLLSLFISILFLAHKFHVVGSYGEVYRGDWHGTVSFLLLSYFVFVCFQSLGNVSTLNFVFLNTDFIATL